MRLAASYVRQVRSGLAAFPRMAYAGLAFGALLVAFLWVGFASIVSQERDLIVHGQLSQNLNLARAFEENVVRTIAAADLVLRDLEAGYRRSARKFDVAGFARERRDSRGPYTLFGIIDENADVTVQDPMPARRLNLRSNDNFRFHAEQDTDALFISTPRKGTTTGRWEFFVSRRINKTDGSFGGFVSVGIDVAYLAAFYDRINLGKDALIVLVGRDGIVRARGSGAGVSAGQDISKAAGFKEETRAKEQGSFASVSPVDGIARLFSFRAIRNYPLIVAVATSEATALQTFRGNRNFYAGILVTASLVILGFSLVAAFQMRTQAHAARHLHQSEQRFALAVRGSSDGIWDWNILTGEDYLSPRWKEILGYRDDEIENIDASFFALIHPEDRARVDEAVRRHLEGGEPYQIEFRMLHKDGSTRWILSRGEAVRDAAGRAVRMVGSITDLTERKNAEDRLLASEARLKEAQALARIGNWELDLVSGKLYWSDEIYRLFEIEPRAFGASYEAFLNAIHPDDRERVNRAYTDSVSNRTGYAIVHRLRMADGRIKHVHERCQTMYAEDGRPLRSVGTVQDITERHLAEEEIRKLNRDLEARVAERTARLEAANRELEMFNSSISHDLKGPLQSIVIYSQLLLRQQGARLDREGRQCLQDVGQTALQMGGLIDDLLAYSRLERRDLQAEPVPLEPLLKQLLAERTEEVRRRAAQVDISAANGAVLTCDREGIAMALRNLLENALKFGGSAPQIEIGAKKHNTVWRLWVKDNGIGFDMKHHDRVFGIFQRLHQAEDYPGTGVGLAIVKKAAERMGGRVWAESMPDKGATFYLEVPK